MSNSDKSDRKFIFGKRHAHTGFNNYSRHRPKSEISVSTSVKRSYDDMTNTSTPEAQTFVKRSNITNDLPKYKSPLLSSPLQSTKNIANKRLQDLRKSLEEKRPIVERKINERLNKSINSASCNSSLIKDETTKDVTLPVPSTSSLIKSWTSFTKSSNELRRNNNNSTSRATYGNKNIFSASQIENKTTKQVSLEGTSSSSSTSIQSRLNLHKTSNDLRKNNSTITTSSRNTTINEKIGIGDGIEITSDIKQSSSQPQFNFLLANMSDKSTTMDDSMEWEPVDEDTILNNVFWFGSAMLQWSFMARRFITDINEIRKEITYDKKLPIDSILNNSSSLTASQNGVFIVIDTNIFLSQMNTLIQLRKKEFKDFNRVTMIVPWMVLQELDYMKETKSCHLGKPARKAVSYINEQLILNDPHFKGQTVLEASKQDMASNNADDGILHCCLQLVADKKYVILLSNDINLRNKVLVNKIQAYSSNDIMENLDKLNLAHFNDTHKINIDKMKIILSNLLTHIVESEMRRAYGDVWLRMVKSNPPYTLDEALGVMFKYWVSVFAFALQKQAQRKIEEFILFIKRHKNADNYSQETYNKFMEHSLTLCVYLKNGYPCYKFLIMESLSNIQKCGE